jgi:fluoride exporter
VTDMPVEADTEAPVEARSPFGTGRPTRAGVPWPILGAISAGGIMGALTRYGIGLIAPHGPTGFPWGVFGINVSGCLLIGVLMVLVTDVWPSHRLLRPFLGTGLLGGYTTFSTYIVDIQHLYGAGVARTALLYLAGTLLAALAAVHVGMTATRACVHRARRPREKR